MGLCHLIITFSTATDIIICMIVFSSHMRGPNPKVGSDFVRAYAVSPFLLKGWCVGVGIGATWVDVDVFFLFFWSSFRL